MRYTVWSTFLASAAFFAPSIAQPTPELDAAGRLVSGNLQVNGDRNPKELKSPEELQKNKYFTEPGDTPELGHYDNRYFRQIVSDKERTETQSHMIRAFLTFFHENNLDTWIAHGTLLGWWWNGKRLPWDFDIDTQVTEATLNTLGTHYNHTKYHYTSPDGKTERIYLLDVNPWIWERVYGDGMNLIDARWIDTSNGLYIDITGLSELHPDTEPGLWGCKNRHEYRTEELYPMRETLFEGIRTKVPYDYDRILVTEYHESALVNTRFYGHEWNSTTKEWVKSQQTLEFEAYRHEELLSAMARQSRLALEKVPVTTIVKEERMAWARDEKEKKKTEDAKISWWATWL